MTNVHVDPLQVSEKKDQDTLSASALEPSTFELLQSIFSVECDTANTLSVLCFFSILQQQTEEHESDAVAVPLMAQRILKSDGVLYTYPAHPILGLSKRFPDGWGPAADKFDDDASNNTKEFLLKDIEGDKRCWGCASLPNGSVVTLLYLMGSGGLFNLAMFSVEGELLFECSLGDLLQIKDCKNIDLEAEAPLFVPLTGEVAIMVCHHGDDGLVRVKVAEKIHKLCFFDPSPPFFNKKPRVVTLPEGYRFEGAACLIRRDALLVAGKCKEKGECVFFTIDVVHETLEKCPPLKPLPLELVTDSTPSVPAKNHLTPETMGDLFGMCLLPNLPNGHQQVAVVNGQTLVTIDVATLTIVSYCAELSSRTHGLFNLLGVRYLRDDTVLLQLKDDAKFEIRKSVPPFELLRTIQTPQQPSGLGILPGGASCLVASATYDSASASGKYLQLLCLSPSSEKKDQTKK